MVKVSSKFKDSGSQADGHRGSISPMCHEQLLRTQIKLGHNLNSNEKIRKNSLFDIEYEFEYVRMLSQNSKFKFEY